MSTAGSEAGQGAQNDTAAPRDAMMAAAPDGPAAAASGEAYAEVRRLATVAPKANPDDPVTRRPRQGKHGPLPGPDDRGAPGRMSIVQGQAFLVATIVLAQLWLVTTALFALLSGHPEQLNAMVIASGIGFLIALLLWLWPRRRVLGG